VNKLALGGRFGTYCIAKSKESKGIKSELKGEQIEEAVISLCRKNVWEDSK
jgi:hypothetical protein